jgi:hypothetical protein
MERFRRAVAGTITWTAERAVQVVIEVHHGWVLAHAEGDVRFPH